jgi:dihydroxyacetone kinase-like protein
MTTQERLTVTDLIAWIEQFAEDVGRSVDILTELDSAIGDADHGTNLARGSVAIRDSVVAAAPADAGALLRYCGMTLVSTVGGASGALYGTFFIEMGKSAGPRQDLDATQLANALAAGLHGIVARGKAEIGDKTMVDALGPAVVALSASTEEGISLADALDAAAEAANAGRDATKPLVARKGRASYLGERSADHMDPGATSAAILIQALAGSYGRRAR